MGALTSACNQLFYAPKSRASAIQRCRLVKPGHGAGQIGVDHSKLAHHPLPLFTLERFGFCGTGEAADFVQDGTIGPGGSLPVNTNGGLLSEAHVAGWNHIREMTRQLRGTAGERQIPGADVLQWGTVWGDSVIMTAA